MAVPISAAAALTAIRARVPRVIERDGWRTHTRTGSGRAWGPVNGVMIHHFGPYSTVQGAVDYAHRGNPPSLPGPLYPILVAPDGTVHLIGWGRTNHAGSGSKAVLDAVIKERLVLPPPGSGTDGNARFYGICLIHPGHNPPKYPAKQLDAAAGVTAALCASHRWTEFSVIGHKEWQKGKPDPAGSMDDFRARVGRVLRPTPPATRPANPAAPSLADRLAALERRVRALEAA